MLKKSIIYSFIVPLPLWEGIKGRGRYLSYHPHPNPLPSRERGNLEQRRLNLGNPSICNKTSQAG